MRILCMIIPVFLVACAHATPTAQEPVRLPISESVDSTIEIPEHVGPSDGEAVPLEAGDEAPFDGVLLDETKAFGAAELRIAYDELHRSAGSQKAAFSVAIRVLEQELQSADKKIAEQDHTLREMRDSWWGKHKGVIMIGVGVIIGGCAAIGAGAVWSKIED